MNWEKRSYMYNEVNLLRHAKFKEECQRQIYQENTEYDRNIMYRLFKLVILIKYFKLL